jgi:hypothetical protein
MTILTWIRHAGFLAILMTPLSLAAQGNGDISFARYAVGPLPPEFNTTWRTGKGAPGTWMVVEDPTASGGKAVAQTSTDQTDYRFPLAVFEGLTAEDLEVTVRFKAVAGTIDQAAGLAVRLTSPDDYYVVRANALENNVRFYRVVKGKREQLDGKEVKVTPGEWHMLGLQAEGDRFTISYDGAPLFTVTDRTFSGVGKVALWTKADSITQFDQLRINRIR